MSLNIIRPKSKSSPVFGDCFIDIAEVVEDYPEVIMGIG